MADKARHAFGALEKIDEAKAAGKIDAYDILFVKDASGKPYVGWIDKDGNKVVVNDDAEFAALESEIATKANAEEVNAELATKADAEEVEALENQMATKADAAEVEEKLSAKADAEKVEALETELATKVTAEEVEAKIDEVETKVGKYTSRMREVAKSPEGTLVDYFDKEIRIMIPKTTDFANFNNGIAGVENMRYIEYRIYAPEGAVGYKSDLDGMVMAGKVEDFASFTDEHGRIYIITFPSIAYYDAESATWVYNGANSTTKHYIGWDYTVEWFDENDVVIASDSVKINLSNEDCHYAVEPYYVGEMMSEVEAKIAKATESAIAIVEF